MKQQYMCKNSIIIIISLMITIGCVNDMKEINELMSKDQLKVETGKGIEIIYSDSAMVRVQVKSPTMLRYDDSMNPKQEFPDGVTVYFYDRDQKVQSILTGKYGIRLEKEQKTIVRDSIHWESNTFETLETSELIWDEKENVIYSNKFTKITKPGEVAYGLGFKTNKEFTNWQITGIEGQFNAGNLEKAVSE